MFVTVADGFTFGHGASGQDIGIHAQYIDAGSYRTLGIFWLYLQVSWGIDSVEVLHLNVMYCVNTCLVAQSIGAHSWWYAFGSKVPGNGPGLNTWWHACTEWLQITSHMQGGFFFTRTSLWVLHYWSYRTISIASILKRSPYASQASSSAELSVLSISSKACVAPR